MAIDVHAHYVPRAVMEEVEKHGSSLGAQLAARAPEGPQLRLGGGAPSRPLIPELLELDSRGARFAERKIERQLLSTWLDIVGYNLSAEEGSRWSRLLNRAMAEALAEGVRKRRFGGVATVPLQAAERAAEELELAVAECGLKGVTIGTHVNGKNLDDPALRPFWRAAERLGAPIIVHPFFPLGSERLGSYFLTHIVGLPAETTLAAASLYCGGVLDSFPDLQVILCHGGGFFPYQFGRLGRGREIRDDIRSATRKLTREALRWFYYDTILFEPSVLEFLVSEAGAEHVLLGSDCPFGIGDPDPTRVVFEARISEAERERILQRNAERLFGIGSGREG